MEQNSFIAKLGISQPFSRPGPVFFIRVAMFSVLLSPGCSVAQDEKLAKSVDIPPSKMTLSWSQKGTARFHFHEDLPFQTEIKAFLALKPTASNIFVSAAPTLTEAIEAAIRFDGPKTIRRELPKDKLWLVVYLGMAPSGPAEWEIKSVKITDSTVTVSYSSIDAGVQRTRDYHPYIAIVELPNSLNGQRRLELRSDQPNALIQMRSIKID